jgi:hypothetical protein
MNAGNGLRQPALVIRWGRWVDFGVASALQRCCEARRAGRRAGWGGDRGSGGDPEDRIHSLGCMLMGFAAAPVTDANTIR